MYTLDKQDLITLIKGYTYVPFELMDQSDIKPYGHYNDLHGWTWLIRELDNLSEQKLWELHLKLKPYQS